MISRTTRNAVPEIKELLWIRFRALGRRHWFKDSLVPFAQAKIHSMHAV